MSSIAGNGLAQVLNWRERPQESTPYGMIYGNQYRQEQLRRQAKEQAYQKARKDSEMSVSGLKYYLPDVQKGVNNLNSSLHDRLNDAQDEFSINRTMSEHMPFINQEKQNIANATKAETSYGEIKKDIDQGKFVNKDFANNLVHDKLLLEPNQQTGRVNYGNIDYQGAYNWGNHPGAHDYSGFTNDWANKLKTKFLEAQYTGEIPGVNGKFWEKQNDQYRFPVDDKGKLKPDFVNFAINQNPKNYDAALWTSIASKNNLDPTHDRVIIDKMFWEEKQKTVPAFANGQTNPGYDPKASEKQHEDVYGIFDNLLQQQQSHISIQNRQSQGHYPQTAGSGATPIQSNIQKDPTLFEYNKLDEAEKQGGVASHGDGSVPYNSDKMSRLEGVYPGKLATFVGTRIDPKNGNAVAKFTDEKGYPLPPLELTQDVRARLNNVAKSKGEGDNISKVLQETDKVVKAGGKMYVNEPELNKKTDEFKNLLFDTKKANDNKETYIDEIKNFLKDNGINTEVSVDRNYGAQWINGGPFVTIKDQKFDLSSEDDKKKVKELLYNNNPSKFSTSNKTQQNLPTPKFDPTKY